MGELKGMNIVNIYTIQKRMEDILTDLEEAIEEAKENNEMIKAESCLGAIYKELINQFEEILDLDHLGKVVSNVDGLLDDIEEYTTKYINMSQEDIKKDYINHLHEAIDMYKDSKKIKFKVLNLISSSPNIPKDILIDFVMEESKGELNVDMAIILVEDVMNQYLMTMLYDVLADIQDECDDEYDEGDEW